MVDALAVNPSVGDSLVGKAIIASSLVVMALSPTVSKRVAVVPFGKGVTCMSTVSTAVSVTLITTGEYDGM